MTLNPELVNADGWQPRLYRGEIVFASRPNCRLTTKHSADLAAATFGIFRARPSSPWAFSGAGTVWLTNYRLVLVPSEPTPQFQAIELPLLYIHDFDVVQPIFGANYLHGNCHTEAPSTAGRTTGRTAVPPGLAWRVDFANGGMSTMVPLFYQTVDFVRRVARDAGGADDVREGRGVRVTRPDFVVDAVVDPNDPTVVYVVAEDDGGIEDEVRKECAFDTLWAKKNV